MWRSIRAKAQAARGNYPECFSNNESSDLVCKADTSGGEVQLVCRLQANGPSLMRAAMVQLDLSERRYRPILKQERTIVDPVGE